MLSHIVSELPCTDHIIKASPSVDLSTGPDPVCWKNNSVLTPTTRGSHTSTTQNTNDTTWERAAYIYSCSHFTFCLVLSFRLTFSLLNKVFVSEWIYHIYSGAQNTEWRRMVLLYVVFGIFVIFMFFNRLLSCSMLSVVTYRHSWINSCLPLTLSVNYACAVLKTKCS